MEPLPTAHQAQLEAQQETRLIILLPSDKLLGYRSNKRIENKDNNGPCIPIRIVDRFRMAQVMESTLNLNINK